ncbi:MAG: hypothetical protein FWC27_09375 [Firmicutes bacterium]|nr:hypothetical protein [Bacillota bacterium]
MPSYDGNTGPRGDKPARKGAVTLRLGIARLRFVSWVAARRLRALRREADIALGKEEPRPLRRWPYVAVLVACLAVAVTGAVVTIMAQGVPMLRTLEGRLPGADEVAVLDPDRRDETKLSPGYLYDRPVAAVHTGAEPVLLRMRLEETLLTASRDENGRVVTVRPFREPGETWSPRTVSREEALQQLVSGGFCKAGAGWEDALGQKLPARRLPGGDSDGGRLLVFEKKTIIADPDSPIPDISVLLPEDIEQYDLGMVIYSYTGFYYINDAGKVSYQPLHVAVDSTAPRRPTQRPPSLTGLSYEFYQWDVTQASVHKFSEDQSAPVNLQPGGLRPIAEWTRPEDAWFYDPADGWVYYGQVLSPGVMTPLLLHSYAVWPESPLLRDESRYRLGVRAQSVPLKHQAIMKLWNSKAQLGTLGLSTMTQEAGAALFGRVYPEGAGVIDYTYEKNDDE